MRILAGIVLLALSASSSVAQPRTATADMLEAWVAQQRNAYGALEHLRLVERSEQEVEGPYRRHTVRYEYLVTVSGRQVERQLRSATVDGEPAEVEKAESHRHRLVRALGSDYASARRLADAPAYLLGRLERTAAPRRDILEGRRAIRVDLHARAAETPIDRATLWFADDPREPVLLESRILLRGEEPANVITLRTSYARVDGPAGALAVPRRQTVEATVQQVRRWRTFTIVVYSTREASEIEATWRADRARTGR